jgi:DNA invertase Pin-like site-specific DNA recombinase
LEQCSTRREAVARHFVALATYLGHTDISNTYWNGKIGGSRPKLDKDQEAEVIKMVTSGEKTQAQAAKLFRVSKATISRIMQREHDKVSAGHLTGRTRKRHFNRRHFYD